MLIFTSEISFPDGAKIKAVLRTESALLAMPVEWSGAIDRITIEDHQRMTRVPELRMLCRVMADKLGAIYSENSTGQLEGSER